jgi:hypothetical protein
MCLSISHQQGLFGIKLPFSENHPTKPGSGFFFSGQPTSSYSVKRWGTMLKTTPLEPTAPRRGRTRQDLAEGVSDKWLNLALCL